MKKYINISVLEAAKIRVQKSFDEFEKLYISFSGGKDSMYAIHLAQNQGHDVVWA